MGWRRGYQRKSEVWRREIGEMGGEVVGEDMEGRGFAGELEGGGNCADRKEGEEREVRDCRGVTLIPTLYKVYTSVLVEKLREKVEGKKLANSNKFQERNGDNR